MDNIEQCSRFKDNILIHIVKFKFLQVDSIRKGRKCKSLKTNTSNRYRDKKKRQLEQSLLPFLKVPFVRFV